LFFAVGLWITEAIPPFAVSLFILAYLVFTMGNPHLNDAPEQIDKYVNTFSSSVIWLLLGGFFMAAAMTKTGLDKRVLMFTLKVSGNNPKKILIAIMTTTMFASMLMSYSATTSMVIAAMMPLFISLGKSGKTKAMLLGISIASATGGMGTIIASSTNAMTAGLLEKAGERVDFLDWMMYGVPVACALNAICCYFLIRLFIKDPAPVDLGFLKPGLAARSGSNTQRKIVVGVIIVTVACWLTTPLHNVTVAAIAAIPIVALTVTGILTSNDIRQLPWDTLFLIAGGLSLGVALESTGTLDYYAHKMKALDLGPVAFLVTLAYLTMLFSNVMSNVATCMLFIPMGMAIIPEWKIEVGIAVGLSASAAAFLPVSTPPNVIAYSTGLMDPKDFRTGGIILGILGPLLAVAWVLLLNM
jgi:sodium-dependent dicarboxylate transporter 2/3/5